MKKILLLSLCLMLASSALAEVTVNAPAAVVHPGKAVILSFESDSEGTADILLKNDDDQEIMRISEDFSVQSGTNRLYWNGTSDGEDAPEGEYRLTVVTDEEAWAPVTVGSPAPVMNVADMPDTIDAGSEYLLSLTLSQSGVVSVSVSQDGVSNALQDMEADEGEAAYIIPALSAAGLELKNGDASLVISVTNDEGVSSTPEYFDVTLTGFGSTPATVQADAAPEEATLSAAPMDQSQFIPSYGTPYALSSSDTSYWNTPMDITDTQRVWNALIAPVTIVTTGKKCTEKTQVALRAEPDEKAQGVGVVTCLTQTVRIIEDNGDGWTKIECYSSSFHDSKVKKWNMLVQGWVKTSFLKTITPNQHMGMVVDKLTQRLYIFVDGELYDVLLVSTGLSNARQPYNETRSGEFLLTSKVGEFASDNLKCGLAIRFNGGDLLHEVPHTTNRDGSSNYSSCEPKLGTRASHGCIRVQRRKTSKGTSMQWIWNNIKKNTKLFIWEDWQGRVYPYPADDSFVYYNPKGGDYYHSAEKCGMAKGKTFSPMAYGDLDNPEYAKLKRCSWCSAPLRKSEIDEVNELHAPGGDHDPILTEARAKEWK